MTLARYVLGVVLAGVAVVPVCGCSWALRELLLPRWSGPPARLAEAVFGLSIVIGVSELLGAVGLFRLAPIVTGLAVVGAVGWYFARRPSSKSGERPVRDAPEARPNRLGRGSLVVAVVATGVVVADWSTRTVAALHHGVGSVSPDANVDSLWYHLPTAAGFVQEAKVTQLHYVGGSVVAFFPANSPLLHAVGMLFLGNDLLSPLLNLGFLTLALLAGWCVGRPFGVAPVTLTGTALLLATPGFVVTQPGGGYNDVVGLAMFVASVAFLVNGTREKEPPGLAVLGVAAAAGLALGTKFTFIVPVAAVSVGVIALVPRGARLLRGGFWFLVVAVAGGFWYLRNLLAVGNPLPGFSFGPFGTSRARRVRRRRRGYPSFYSDGSSWEKYFLPGLGMAYGPAWWALIALVAAGLFLAVLTGLLLLTERMLGCVGLVAAVGYVFSPQYLTIGEEPLFFVLNLRYVSPALLLGLLLLPLVPALNAARRGWWVLGAFAVVLSAIQLDPSVWPTNIFGLRLNEPIRGSDSIVGILVGAVVLLIGVLLLVRWEKVGEWRPRAAVVAVIGLFVVVGGFGLQRVYLRDRYNGAGPPLAPWARGVTNERIAIAIGGYTNLVGYPLYGKDLSNYVQFVGKKGPQGGFTPIGECAEWRRALNTERYSYVVTGDRTPEALWTTSDSAVTRVEKAGPNGPRPPDSRFPAASVFRIKGRLDPAGCKLLPENQQTKVASQPPPRSS